MGNLLLFFIIMLLFAVSFTVTQDYLSPPCVVCESFLLAFFCALISSEHGGWNFELEFFTVILFIIGISFFVFGSILVKASVKKNTVLRVSVTEINHIKYNKKIIKCILVFQIVYLCVYVIYFIRSIGQFGGLDWYDMIRMQRLTASYGEGLDLPIPFLVMQGVKIVKTNAYIGIYLFLHNLVVSKFKKEKSCGDQKKLILIFVLYLPYSILQSARFEIIVSFIGALVIWYALYQYYAMILGRKRKSNFKIFRTIIFVLVILMASMSILGPVVGREASTSILAETSNYMGRSLQAFNEYLSRGIPLSEKHMMGNETFVGLYDDLCKLGFMANEESTKIYLTFTYKDGISLGNTYTAFYRYYSDFDIWGVILIPFIEGVFMMYLYIKLYTKKNFVINNLLVFYAMIVHSIFFYALDGLFTATIISTNYLILYVLIIEINKLLLADIELSKSMKIRIRRDMK